MKKWLHRLLVVALLIGLTCGGLFEYSTHMCRGWLFGEAHFEDRPTSYWRGRIDRWIARHPSPEDAERSMKVIQVYAQMAGNSGWGIGAGQILYLPDHTTSTIAIWSRPTPTHWQRLQNLLTGRASDDDELPKVLHGSRDAELVLDELHRDARYRPFVEQARRNAAIFMRQVTIVSPY